MVCLEPNGKLLATTGQFTTALWDIESAEMVHKLDSLPEVNSMSFSPDGTRLVIGCRNEYSLWNVSTGQKLFALDFSTDGSCASFDPTGKRFAVPEPGAITVRDTEKGLVRLTLKVPPGQIHWIQHICFSPDNKRIAAANGQDIIVWDLTDSSQHAVLHGHPSFKVTQISLSPDGRRLVSAGTNGEIKLWDVDYAQEVDSIDGHNGSILCLGFSDDGQRIFSASFSTTNIPPYGDVTFQIDDCGPMDAYTDAQN
jgi:WD40 repeat protein